MAQEIEKVMGGDADKFQARLDNLLSSALEEKAREEKALVDALRGLRADLARMQQELTAVRHMVEHPSEGGFAALEGQLAATSAQVSEIPSHIQGSNEAYSASVIKRILSESARVQGTVQELVEAIDGRMNGMLEAIDARLMAFSEMVSDRLAETGESIANDVEVAQDAILEQVGQTHAEASEAAALSTQRLKAFIAGGITSILNEAFSPFSKRLETAAGKLEKAEREIAESNNRVQTMQTSLITFLRERDERLEHTRDQAFLDLVEKVAENLGKKGSKAVPAAIRDAQRKRQNERDAERYRKLQAETATGVGGSTSSASPARVGRADDWSAKWTEAVRTGITSAPPDSTEQAPPKTEPGLAPAPAEDNRQEDSPVVNWDSPIEPAPKKTPEKPGQGSSDPNESAPKDKNDKATAKGAAAAERAEKAAEDGTALQEEEVRYFYPVSEGEEPAGGEEPFLKRGSRQESRPAGKAASSRPKPLRKNSPALKEAKDSGGERSRKKTNSPKPAASSGTKKRGKPK